MRACPHCANNARRRSRHTHTHTYTTTVAGTSLSRTRSTRPTKIAVERDIQWRLRMLYTVCHSSLKADCRVEEIVNASSVLPGWTRQLISCNPKENHRRFVRSQIKTYFVVWSVIKFSVFIFSQFLSIPKFEKYTFLFFNTKIEEEK